MTPLNLHVALKHLKYQIQYSYDDNDLLIGIAKKIDNEVFYLRYDYDDLLRVKQKNVFYNSNLVISMSFERDFYGQIIGFYDGNIKIAEVVKDSRNLLKSFVIIDKMGKKIVVRNNFSNTKYLYTELMSENDCTKVINMSYVDNMNLKDLKPSEEDLNFILMSLLKKTVIKTRRSNLVDFAVKNPDDIIDNNVKTKLVPISMRKRLLYNIVKASSV